MDKADFYRDARTDLTGPLQGITALEATTTWAGPMAGCLLADFGADVIKVEHPTGEIGRRLRPLLPDSKASLSLPHETVNRNKRSMTLNLSSPAGRDVFLDLARRVDVVVENFRPGTMAGWGVGYEQVRAVKPDIVYVSISGFGQFGGLSHRVGYDPVAQHFSGFTSINGDPEGEPVKAATFLGDDLAGLHGALGALAALRHRDRTGEGQHVDVALVDTLLFQSNGNLAAGALGITTPRTGNEFTVCAPTNMYACVDGHAFAGVLIDAHWRRLASMLGHGELADDPRYATLTARLNHRADVDRLLADWCAQRRTADVVAAFDANGLPAVRVNTYAEAAAEPHVDERDMLQRVRLHDGTEAPLVGPAAKFSRTPTRVRAAAEPLGSSTEQLLRELGYDVDAIAQLRQQGAI
jgi:formyl-CoA transferase